MTSIIENQGHNSMDAHRTVHLTMTEIKEMVFQMNEAVKRLESDSSENNSSDSGVNEGKIVMINQLIEKLQGNDKS